MYNKHDVYNFHKIGLHDHYSAIVFHIWYIYSILASTFMLYTMNDKQIESLTVDSFVNATCR